MDYSGMMISRVQDEWYDISFIQMTGHKVSVTDILPRRFDGAALVHHQGAAGMEAATLGGIEGGRDIAREDDTMLLFTLLD